jgi:hypothetical protein
LQNGHFDGAATRVPNLPRPVRGRLASLFGFFTKRDALPALQPQFAGSLQPPVGLRGSDPWERERWRDDRPFELSGFEVMESYQVQDALKGGPETISANFYVAEPPQYFALGQGRYWVKDIGSNYSLARNGSVQDGLILPLREGTFRLLTTFEGDSLLLQQQRAKGGWQTQLHLLLRTPADSLVQRYGRNHFNPVDLAAPVQLQARAGRLQLRVYLLSLNREEVDHKPRYSYTGEGMLQIEP